MFSRTTRRYPRTCNFRVAFLRSGCTRSETSTYRETVSRQTSPAEGECVRRNQILPRIRGDHRHVALPAVGWLCVRSAAEPSVLIRSWNTPTSAHRDRNLPLLRLDQSSGSSPLPKQHHHHSRSRHPDARVMALNVAAAISSHRKHRRLGRA